MRQEAPPRVTPRGKEKGGSGSIGGGGDTANANANSTPTCVLGALSSPFGSAVSSLGETPVSTAPEASCRVTTRRQSRLSAAAAAAAAAAASANANAATTAAPAAAASLLKPQPLPSLTDSLFAPLAAGLDDLRTRSSLSFEDKVREEEMRRRRVSFSPFFACNLSFFHLSPLLPLLPPPKQKNNRSPPPPPRSSTLPPPCSTRRPSPSRAPSSSSASSAARSCRKSGSRGIKVPGSATPSRRGAAPVPVPLPPRPSSLLPRFRQLLTRAAAAAA